MTALLLRFWPYIAGAVVVGMLLALLAIRTEQRDTARARLETANAYIERQNAEVTRLGEEGEAARAEARRAIAQARAARERQRPVTQALRQPRQHTGQCTVPQDVRAVESQL